MSHLPLIKREIKARGRQDQPGGSAPPSEQREDIGQNEGAPKPPSRPTLRRFSQVKNEAAAHEYYVLKDEITRTLLEKGLDYFDIFMCHWGHEKKTALPCLEIILCEELTEEIRAELQETFEIWKCEHLKRMFCFPRTFLARHRRDSEN